MRNKGFTLIEIIVVIAFIVTISAIVFPNFVGCTEAAKEQVCNSNCKTIERTYNEYLEIEKLEHSEAIFNQYIIDNGYDICPEQGVITYEDNEVHCSIHNPIIEDEKEDNESVPFL